VEYVPFDWQRSSRFGSPAAGEAVAVFERFQAVIPKRLAQLQLLVQPPGIALDFSGESIDALQGWFDEYIATRGSLIKIEFTVDELVALKIRLERELDHPLEDGAWLLESAFEDESLLPDKVSTGLAEDIGIYLGECVLRHSTRIHWAAEIGGGLLDGLGVTDSIWSDVGPVLAGFKEGPSTPLGRADFISSLRKYVAQGLRGKAHPAGYLRHWVNSVLSSAAKP